tara:strand:+ start:732 stop:863 length:132 start_codon:yes stop_codon:yes gene_type:complete
MSFREEFHKWFLINRLKHFGKIAGIDELVVGLRIIQRHEGRKL